MGCFSGVTSSQFHSSRARQYRYRYIVPNTLPIPTSHPPYQGLHLVSAPLFGVLRGLGRCSGGVLDLLYAQYIPMLSTKTLVLRMVSGTEYHTYRVCVHTLRYCVWDILSHLLSLWCRYHLQQCLYSTVDTTIVWCPSTSKHYILCICTLECRSQYYMYTTDIHTRTVYTLGLSTRTGTYQTVSLQQQVVSLVFCWWYTSTSWDLMVWCILWWQLNTHLLVLCRVLSGVVWCTGTSTRSPPQRYSVQVVWSQYYIYTIAIPTNTVYTPALSTSTDAYTTLYLQYQVVSLVFYWWYTSTSWDPMSCMYQCQQLNTPLVVVYRALYYGVQLLPSGYKDTNTSTMWCL